MNIQHIEKWMETKPLHIILEGIDGSGKSTLALELHNLFHDLFPYRVHMLRNPASSKLYEQMHAGVLSGYQIAMSTLADGWENMAAFRTNYVAGNVFIQDRSAILSAMAYNLHRMTIWERLIWKSAAQESVSSINCDGIVVMLANNPHRTEENVFSGESAVEAAYGRMISERQDFLGNVVIPFVSDKTPKESAIELINTVNKWLGDNNE